MAGEAGSHVVELSEAELLSRAATGDRQALTALLERHAPALREALAGRISSRWRAVVSVDDVLQETYCDVFLAIRPFVPERDESFHSWLSKIALHNLHDALRGLDADKRGGGRHKIESSAQQDPSTALWEALFATDSTPSGHAARDESASRLRAATRRLPDDYRTIIEMFDLAGRPMDEVARVLACSPGAAFMRRKRAHRLLRHILGATSNNI